MPYPVPPPEPPAIVRHLPPEKIAHATGVSVGALSLSGHLGENEVWIALDGEKAAIAQTKQPETIDSDPNLIEIDLLGDNVSQSISTSPHISLWASAPTVNSEPLDPEPSPFSTAKSAALLGDPVSVSAIGKPDAIVGNWKLEKVFSQLPVPVGQASHLFQSQAPEELEIAPEGHIAPSIGPIEISIPTERPPSAEQPQPPPTTAEENFPALVGIIEVFSDRQEFDALRQIFTAEGNVVLRYQGGVLDADRLQGNLVNRTTVAEGNVAFRRGGQVLRGERLVYNFVQDTGTLTRTRGELFLPSSGTDLSFDFPAAGTATSVVADRPLSDRLLQDQPAQQVTGAGGLVFSVGGGRANADLPPVRSGAQGLINRLRYEAESIDLYPRGSIARNIRITNDPFSPPELEIRADRAILTRESPLRDVVETTRPRLVFDQKVSIPLLRSRYVFDRTDREPPIARLGYDAEERGGLFIEAPVDVYRSDLVRVRLTPQFFLQRAVTQGFGNPAELFGLRAIVNSNLTPRTAVTAAVVVRNFDLLDDAEDKIRASLRAQQIIGTRYPHRLTLEYSFRDRLYNGSLGYQTIQESFGALLTSPVFVLGNTGINLFYQLGAQNINSDTDRLDLLEPIRENNRVTLGRFQASATVSRGFFLWRGKPLPATPTEGLRYTPYPVIPFVQIVPSLTGTTSAYTSGDNQSSLTASIGLQGQFGHFSRPFLDYTGFNIRYTQVVFNGLSPFFFDRIVDSRVFSFGINQQVYGPFRVGFQSSINLDTNESISTDYFVEYSRRTYGVILRYNPDLQLGAIVFRVSDFNWNAGADPFGGSGVRFVDSGVVRETD